MKKLLLLNGSPRRKKTSYSFSRTMKMLWEDMGGEAEILNVMDYFKAHNMDNLMENIKSSDIIALVSPLYADALPYIDTWLLEKLYEHREMLVGKGFLTVGQCGFPDVTRIEPITNTGRIFALETGMNWYGGLGYGGGAMLDGKLLEDLGKKGEKMTAAFKLALESISREEEIPHKAQEMLTVKIPMILCRPLCMMLNSMSRKQAKKLGTDVERKFYLE